MQIPIKQIVLAIIIFGILVNLGPFGSIGHRAQQPGYQKILQLADAGVIGADIIRQRRGLYIALRQFAPGANVILPIESDLDVAQLYGLGRPGHVSHIDYDPKDKGPVNNLSERLSAYIVARDTGGDLQGPGSFIVAIADKNPETVIFLKRNDIWYIVDSALLSPEAF